MYEWMNEIIQAIVNSEASSEILINKKKKKKGWSYFKAEKKEENPYCSNEHCYGGSEWCVDAGKDLKAVSAASLPAF